MSTLHVVRIQVTHCLLPDDCSVPQDSVDLNGCNKWDLVVSFDDRPVELHSTY